MKLASFRWAGRDRIGFALDDARVVDLAEVAAKIGRWTPVDMIALIEAGDNGRALLRDAQAFMDDNPGKVPAIPIEEIQWHPPVRRPSKICGVALNNSASDARKISSPNHPLFFLKPLSALCGPADPIIYPSQTCRVDYEGELAIVIRKRCRHNASAPPMCGPAPARSR